MLYLLIGHRGVGKSTLLRRLAAYFRAHRRPLRTFDLDQIVAERSGIAIGELFVRDGEAAFRQRERATLAALLGELGEVGKAPAAATGEGDVCIALGAGFDGELPAAAQVIWVRRESDSSGRIFVSSDGAAGRPRLDATVSPLTEFLARFAAREQRYRDRCQLEWSLPEGLDQAAPEGGGSDDEAERVGSLLWTPMVAPVQPLGGVLSLLAKDFAHGPAAWQDFIARRLGWPGVRFELRDDLLDDTQLALAQATIPPARRLWSLRRRPLTAAALAAAAASGGPWDYPLEFGLPPAAVSPPVLSLHERLPGESLAAAAARLTSAGDAAAAGLLKLAVETATLAELLAGWDWAAADPTRRAFLPRSPSGRWRWFRLVFGRTAPLAFFREGDGTGLDQPLLADWWRSRGLSDQRFAAVLGDPVGHSRTPLEHHRFFAARRLPIVAVPLSEAEWAAGGLAILERLGLRYAAVTAPLKRAAASRIGLGAADAVNTLYYADRQQRWHGTNTDPLGAQALLGPLGAEPAVAVWGGGGTTPALRAVLPNARYFSARSGQPIVDTGPPLAADWQPQVLVWAIGRSRLGACRWPDPGWRPVQVVDLNYSEDSPGREYAQRVAADYTSGLAMFRAQAAGQRQFWQQMEQQSTGGSAVVC